jgi:hypothetical protein
MNTSLKIIDILLKSADIEFIQNKVVNYKNGIKIYLDSDELNQLIFFFHVFDLANDVLVTAIKEEAINE